MRNRQCLLDLTQQETRRIRRRGDGKYMCELPQDLIIEILRRLQTKYLMRFKCVSKQWSSLIFSRYFCNSLYTATRQRRQQPRLYISLVNKENMERVLLSASSTFIDNTTCLVVDQDLSISGMGSFFLNSVRGLMCFSVRENACIYNPSTKQLLKLPKIKADIDIIDTLGQKKYPRYYIGHDPVSDQYKILCTMVIPSRNLAYRESEHWVFALEAGGSWKKVDPPKYYHHHTPVSLGWFTSGSVVHYMALVKMYNYAVVSFDVRSEELTIALVPMKGYLIEYDGKIVFFDISYRVDGSFADVWVLEDVNVGGKKWSKKRIVLQPCQRHLVSDTITKWVVKGTTQDGKVILAPSEMRSPFYILCYDMQSNDLKKVEIKEIPHLWLYTKCCFDLKLMDESESFVYLEN